jgi:hypothetical protein
LTRNERKCCLALKIAARLTAGLGRIEIVRLSADPVEACARSDSHPRFCEGGPRELQKRCGRHSELVAVCAAKTGPDLAQSPGTFTNVVQCASAYPGDGRRRVGSLEGGNALGCQRPRDQDRGAAICAVPDVAGADTRAGDPIAGRLDGAHVPPLAIASRGGERGPPYRPTQRCASFVGSRMI